MCAQSASGARGIRLPQELSRSIEDQAGARGISWSAMATELLEEAVRMRRAPGILFVDGATGRRAAVAGTGLDVWEVVRSWVVGNRDHAALVEDYPWLTPMQLNAAIGYYFLYPHEIDERLAREEALTEEYVRTEYPYLTPRE